MTIVSILTICDKKKITSHFYFIDSVTLIFQIDNINLRIVRENQFFNFDVQFKNTSADVFKTINTSDKLWSKVMSTFNVLESNNHSVFHGMYL